MTKPASLRVAIIGGGIAGLAAARILREAHEVTIYEANDPRVSEAGAAVGLGPNGSKMAMALGLSQERVKAVISSGFRVYDQSGTLLKESKIDCGKAFGSDWWMVHRQDLKNALLEAAMGHDPSISSKPAKIIYGSRVEKVNADTGTVFFEDGSQVEADFIIGMCLYWSSSFLHPHSLAYRCRWHPLNGPRRRSRSRLSTADTSKSLTLQIHTSSICYGRNSWRNSRHTKHRQWHFLVIADSCRWIEQKRCRVSMPKPGGYKLCLRCSRHNVAPESRRFMDKRG